MLETKPTKQNLLGKNRHIHERMKIKIIKPGDINHTTIVKQEFRDTFIIFNRKRPKLM